MASNYDVGEALQEVQQTLQDMYLDKQFLTEDLGNAMLYTEGLPQTQSIKTQMFSAGAGPIVREWVGEKVFDEFRFFDWNVEVKEFASNFRIPQKYIRYDKSGFVKRVINSWISTQPTMVGDVIFDALVSNSGQGPVGFDGVNLISASHPFGPGGSTQSNLTSAAFSFAGYDAARVSMRSLRNELGKSFNAANVLVMAGPKNERTAKEVLNSDNRVIAVNNAGEESGTRVAAASAPNIYVGDSQLFINPKLVGDYEDYVYMIDTSTMPMLWIPGMPPTPVERTDMKDSNRFYNKMLEWSIEFDGVATAGWWPSIHAFIP